MDYPYLLNQLKKDQPEISAEIDLLKHELDQRIYYYGRHFKHPKEKNNQRENIFFSIKYFLKNIYVFYLSFKASLIGKNKGIIISNAYFFANREFARHGFKVLRPMHNLSMGEPVVGNFRILLKFNSLYRKIRNADFNYLLSDKFLDKMLKFSNDLLNYYKSIDARALIVPSDITFFEQLNISIFKKLEKPSFIFLHGLPARYNIYDDNQTDYLIVWGEKIRQNYIDVGFKPDKILVSGHPFYSQLSNQPLRNNFKNILVVSKSLHGAQQRDKVRFADRGNLIFYLNTISNELRRLGVKKARLRVHPSEDIDWYFKFIDKEFFVEDDEPLHESLQKSSLIIGPTSTIFLESIYYGVNYVVYEPVVNGVDLSGYPLVNPFDGSDPRVPVAKNEKELGQLLTEKKMIDKTVFNDYIYTPFNIQSIINLI